MKHVNNETMQACLLLQAGQPSVPLYQMEGERKEGREGGRLVGE